MSHNLRHSDISCSLLGIKTPKMPFLAEKVVLISNKDLLSWIFEEQKFDVDKPVRVKHGLVQLIHPYLVLKSLTKSCPNLDLYGCR